MRRMQQFHFVGIGGAGMSGIAEVLLNLGYQVSGSDLADNEVLERLRSLGAEIHIGHQADQVTGADVVVVSSAVESTNAELQAARDLRIPVVPRAEMLAELMRFRQGIAVAGTHGKTTTTSLTASILAEADLDPTFVIGGLVNAFGSNARLGTGEYLVAEADESDGSFLLLQPVIAVITNIDRDHLEAYEHSFDNLRRAFVEFTHHLPFYGIAVVCIDDPEVRQLIPEITRTVVTYGLSDEADIRAADIRQHGRIMEFTLILPDLPDGLPMRLNMPGSHNVSNALGALAVAWELDVSPAAMQQALENFAGISRRFSNVGRFSLDHASFDVLEDYGHHPSEISATLEAARNGWPSRRVVLVFQPHRYSRTQDLFEDFSRVLSEADCLVLTEIYPAGEEPVDGVDSRTLCASIRARGKVNPVLIPAVSDLGQELPALLEDDDLVLLMGAGSIGGLASQWRKHGFAQGAAA